MNSSKVQRTFTLAVAAVLMSTYQLSPIPAWACSAQTSGSFAYSSNTGPTSVTVCAKSVATTRTVATPTKPPVVKAPATKAPAAKAPAQKAPVAKSTPKPVAAPVKSVSLLTPITKGVPAALQKPVIKPLSKPKPVAAPLAPSVPTKSSFSESTVISDGEVSFSPAPISVSSSATSATIGQSVDFWANASTHYKSGMLLGKATDVRFTPVKTIWSSGQGQSGVGASMSFAFSRPGTVGVAATVTYVVDYQISGASGWESGGEISVSDAVELSIESADASVPVVLPNSSPSPPKVVRLVGSNCLTKRSTFGCKP